MPLGRSAAHKIRVLALELAKALISKEALKGFQRGVGFLIRWQNYFHSRMPLSFAVVLACSPGIWQSAGRGA